MRLHPASPTCSMNWKQGTWQKFSTSHLYNLNWKRDLTKVQHVPPIEQALLAEESVLATASPVCHDYPASPGSGKQSSGISRPLYQDYPASPVRGRQSTGISRSVRQNYSASPGSRRQEHCYLKTCVSRRIRGRKCGRQSDKSEADSVAGRVK